MSTYRKVSFVLATSAPLDAYGGVQLAEEALERMADTVNAGHLPFHFNHDPRQPLDVTNVRAWTERQDDGSLVVRGEMEMRASHADWYEERCREMDAPGGMSFSATTDIRTFPSTDPKCTGSIRIAADAGHYSSDEIETSAEALSRLGNVRACSLYQFQFEPLPVVVAFFHSGVPAVAWNLVSSYLFASLTRLRRASPVSRFQFEVHETSDERHVSALVETSDPDVLEAAIDKLKSVLESPGGYHWDNGKWQPVGPSREIGQSGPSREDT